MFENGEATDVVTKSHKGDAPRRVSQQIKQFVWMWRGVDGHALATIEMADG